MLYTDVPKNKNMGVLIFADGVDEGNTAIHDWLDPILKKFSEKITRKDKQIIWGKSYYTDKPGVDITIYHSVGNVCKIVRLCFRNQEKTGAPSANITLSWKSDSFSAKEQFVMSWPCGKYTAEAIEKFLLYEKFEMIKNYLGL